MAPESNSVILWGCWRRMMAKPWSSSQAVTSGEACWA
jgi:hypothetical protein